MDFPFAPFRLSGAVYGCLMNHRPALAALGDAANAAPYKTAPQAPVLYVKPRNTVVGDGASVVVPADVAELELGAALGLVIGRTACRVRAADAFSHFAGLTLVADISVPHESFYRPSVRFKARDGFCPIGPRVVPLIGALSNPDALSLRVFVDGVCVQTTTTGDRFRGAAQLLADVSEFMTLSPGDVLMLGVSHGAPRVRTRQEAAVEVDRIGRLTMRFVAEEVLT
jgi:5-oxopent-3-ene-1,2,5-tricarboxylate decarboxylase/2-hydroxyhepta-2,4-diene-1,7-dioate isomerase